MERGRAALPFMVSRRGIGLALALSGAVAVVFAAWPALDLRAAATFYDGNGHFIAMTHMGDLVRRAFYAMPATVLGLLTLLCILRRAGRPLPWAPTGRAIVMLVASFVLGPGLLVNVVLKDHWHRPRPNQVQQFGGTVAFRPYDHLDGQCRRNCSFVSGEGSSSFWTTAPALLLPPPWRAAALGAALVFAAATGLLRMAFGGHFLSDTLFAALFTWLVIAGCWHAILGGGEHSGTSTEN